MICVFPTYSIKAFDSSKPEKGAIFRIEVLAIKANNVDKLGKPELQCKDVLFGPNTIHRYFINVPEEATWAGTSYIMGSKRRNANVLIYSYIIPVSQ